MTNTFDFCCFLGDGKTQFDQSKDRGQPGLGEGLVNKRLVTGLLPTGLGQARATWAHLTVGPPPAGGAIRVRCKVLWGGSRRQCPWCSDSVLPKLNPGSIHLFGVEGA